MIRIVAVALVLGIGPIGLRRYTFGDFHSTCGRRHFGVRRRHRSHDDGLSVGSTNLASQHGEGIEIAPLQPGPDGRLPSGLVIYFDYDSSDIRSDFNEILRAMARTWSRIGPVG